MPLDFRNGCAFGNTGTHFGLEPMLFRERRYKDIAATPPPNEDGGIAANSFHRATVKHSFTANRRAEPGR
ncbi:hypothetical protein BH10ACI2_BH10ACI2_01380 [soil metagenome]